MLQSRRGLGCISQDQVHGQGATINEPGVSACAIYEYRCTLAVLNSDRGSPFESGYHEFANVVVILPFFSKLAVSLRIPSSWF